MSIWGDIEVFKVDGKLKAYIKIQNEWSGSITEVFRSVKYRDGHYCCKADGKEIDLDREVTRLQVYDEKVKDALEKARYYS